ncbi:SGNH/GDSL hydrolase family protein [Sphingomonas alpina]|uniref:SGNH/GDSL hydrolase family protein n=1 Tax=Sphingomonas alpina TaxID=653931 RepID=A0A7H0LFF8_9SPHN|nr:SGNH/GDSL hydrolase family protein [Sphingomonas alpina]QNQ08411.1 SGNH/GDSL hydrolase family protein [Sphingomonas alpina]
MNRLSAALAALALVAPGSALAADWVPGWSASPQAVWGEGFVLPAGVPVSLEDRTVRQVVRIGIGGTRVRIRLSNAYGRSPVRIAGVHLARSTGGSAIAGVTDRVVTFGGEPGVVLAPGASVLSDAVSLPVGAAADLAVSLYFRGAVPVDSFHWDGRRSAYILRGDHLAAPAFARPDLTSVRLFLSDVLVEAPTARGTVVVLGDSITDGAGATMEAERRWPDYLAARAAPQGISVVNAGISGARLLSDGMGSNALARIDRDVLAQPGVRTLILLLGINDIAWPGTPFAPDEPPMRFERLAAGYRQIVARAHANGVRVVGATLTPFAGALPGTPMAATYYSAEKDSLRRRINDWIRSSGTFDTVVDFDRLLSDPAAPATLRRDYDSGDRLHPGDAGNAAMAGAIDLATLIGGSGR